MNMQRVFYTQERDRHCVFIDITAYNGFSCLLCAAFGVIIIIIIIMTQTRNGKRIKHTGIVAAASGINPPLPAAFKQTAFPLASSSTYLLLIIFGNAVRTQVTDLQALEVPHKVIERHPVISQTKLSYKQFPVLNSDSTVEIAQKMKTISDCSLRSNIVCYYSQH